MKKVKVEVEGMTCMNCENHVKSELERIGAKKVRASHVDKSVIFNIKDFDDAKVKNAIKVAGYKPGKVFVKEEKSLLGGIFK